MPLSEMVSLLKHRAFVYVFAFVFVFVLLLFFVFVCFCFCFCFFLFVVLFFCFLFLLLLFFFNIYEKDIPLQICLISFRFMLQIFRWLSSSDIFYHQDIYLEIEPSQFLQLKSVINYLYIQDNIHQKVRFEKLFNFICSLRLFFLKVSCFYIF